MSGIGAAVVGTGFIGVVHVEALRRIGVEVTGVVGSSPDRAREKPGFPEPYESLEAALGDDRVDVVHLTTPNHLHYPQVKAVLAAGKHVVCEKPLALNSEESGELLQLAEASGLVHCTNYNVRFYPLLHEARERVRRGDVGTVWNCHGTYIQDWLHQPTDWNWRLDPELGGSLRAVADIGTHWFDLTGWITGRRVAEVFADLFTVHPVRHVPTGPVETYADAGEIERVDREMATEDIAHVLLRYEDGTRGQGGERGVRVARDRLAERRRPLLRPGIDDVHTVAVALPVQRSRVEEADETRPEHAHPVADHRAAPSSFVDDVSTEPTRYLAAARDLLDRLESQSEAVGEAAVLCADAIAANWLVHLFGTGHSRMPVEEMFPRYGSYPGFHPIVELSMTFHTQVVGANGQRQAMFIERVEGLAETILANFEFGHPDVMLVFSASGLTAVPIEIAIGAKKRGLPVVAVTSVAQSLAAEPTHSTGTRLLDHADVLLDLCTPPGDAMVVLEGVGTPVGPGSTIAAVALVNELKVRTAELLIERGALPPVLSSAAVVGADESKRLFDAAYAEHARRLAQVLRKT
jgi:predicted dehydrogenase